MNPGAIDLWRTALPVRPWRRHALGCLNALGMLHNGRRAVWDRMQAGPGLNQRTNAHRPYFWKKRVFQLEKTARERTKLQFAVINNLV